MTGALLNECHLVDFLDCGNSSPNLCQPAFAQCRHSLFARDSFDFRSRAAVHNHFANAVGEIHQFTDRRTAVIARARALQASNTFDRDHAFPYRRIEAESFQIFGSVFLGPFAIRADDAHQTLREDAVQRRDKVVWLNAHVHETADNIGYVIRVDRCEYQMTSEGGLNGDLRRFLVADFANHDFVGVVPQDRPQASGKSEALLLVHRNLRDAANLVFDGVFYGDEFVVVAFDFINGRVQGGGLPRPRGPGHKNQAERLRNEAPKRESSSAENPTTSRLRLANFSE